MARRKQSKRGKRSVGRTATGVVLGGAVGDVVGGSSVATAKYRKNLKKAKFRETLKSARRIYNDPEKAAYKKAVGPKGRAKLRKAAVRRAAQGVDTPTMRRGVAIKTIQKNIGKIRRGAAIGAVAGAIGGGYLLGRGKKKKRTRRR